MKNEWRFSFGWFYFAVFVMMVLTFAPTIKKIAVTFHAREQAIYEAVPTLTLEQLKEKMKGFEMILGSPAKDDPEEYYKLFAQFRAAQESALKFSDSHDRVLQREIVPLLLNNQAGLLMEKYRERHGLAKLAQARIPFEKNLYKLPPEEQNAYLRNTSPIKEDYRDLSRTFAHSYLASLLIMLAFFTVRLKEKKLRVLVEFWRIVPATVVWPVAIFRYPSRINLKEQSLHALRFAAYAFSVLISFCPMGKIAKAQTKSEYTGEKAQSLFIKEKKVDISLKALPLTLRGTTGWYIEPQYNWLLKTGIGAFSGFGFVQFGDEVLFTNHIVSYRPLQSLPFSLLSESGATKNHPFWNLGLQTHVNDIPHVGEITKPFMRYLNAAYIRNTAGESFPEEWSIGWEIKPLKLGDFSITPEGFSRFRPHGNPDFHQMDVWISHRSAENIKVGAEIQKAGSDPPKVLFGVKVEF